MTENAVIEPLPEVTGRKWSRACTTDEVPEDEGLLLTTLPKTSVFAADGEFYCVDDTCTHETYSLAEGWLEGCIVECTLHNAKFDLRTGEALSPPAERAIAVHPVIVKNNVVYVALPQNYLVKSEQA
ncbi:bifunctional 3-phenylpropionate/cinnamic acid dioxygenase ferredoxin subunit [Arthrobacter sp. efr-133-TYG-118]|uniref:bifunctional 3-phenylpropionate/cinnamic acid dioxygenase ferredoxin subunit n=1 Tax=Arthrobacter sp. efr-133-TYG-118 TaxID=3040279 RepID=UPI00254FA6FB|nr:bifunctional 3-phenylpropionate/cinnamic acid dioxygenase ferredoxin subunit [Arthrobacter sp. efr-133-TYG-118]